MRDDAQSRSIMDFGSTHPLPLVKRVNKRPLLDVPAVDNAEDARGEDGGGGGGGRPESPFPRRFPREARADSVEIEHTGLSPRMSRMGMVLSLKKTRTDESASRSFEDPRSSMYFLEDDGVETLEAVDEPEFARQEMSRMGSVRSLFLALNRRLERAAAEAGYARNDAAVLALGNNLRGAAARLEFYAAKRYEPDGMSRNYRDFVGKIIDWIESSGENEIKEVIEGSVIADERLLLHDSPSLYPYLIDEPQVPPGAMEIEMLEL